MDEEVKHKFEVIHYPAGEILPADPECYLVQIDVTEPRKGRLFVDISETVKNATTATVNEVLDAIEAASNHNNVANDPSYGVEQAIKELRTRFSGNGEVQK